MAEGGWCGLWRYIKRGRGVGRFGHVGQVWWPLVGQGGRGVGERGLGGALVGPGQRGGAAAQYSSVEKSSCMDLLPPSSKH
jgi:hypothetical protein